MAKILTKSQKRVLIRSLLSQHSSARAEYARHNGFELAKGGDTRPAVYAMTRREILHLSRHLDTVSPLTLCPFIGLGSRARERLVNAVNGPYVQPSIYDGQAREFGAFMVALEKLGISVTHK